MSNGNILKLIGNNEYNLNMNWRLVLIIIFILEGIYYLTNRFLFNRTFKEINFWEWIIVIMIIPLIFGYLYVNQGTL